MKDHSHATRVFDATLHNAVANHPDVLPNLGNGMEQTLSFRDDGIPVFGMKLTPIDFTDLTEEPDYFVLLRTASEHCATIFEESAPTVWEFHLLFTPECRGRAALDEATAMVDWMFRVHGATMVWGQIPEWNRAAQMFVRQLGGLSVGSIPHAKLGIAHRFMKTRDDWLVQHALG